MTMSRIGAGVGAAAFGLGLSVLGPQALGVAVADTSDSGSAVSTARDQASAAPSAVGRSRAGSGPARPGNGRAVKPAPTPAVSGAGVVAASARPAAAQPSSDVIAQSRRSTSSTRGVPSRGVVLVSRPAGVAQSDAKVAELPPGDGATSGMAVAATVDVGASESATGRHTLAASVSAAAALATRPATPPAMQALNTAVANWFDSSASWLSGLPASPFQELIEGGLLLVRRTLFNQLPAAVPDMFMTIGTGALAGTRYVGTVGAIDTEGDELSYSLAQAPQYGTVEITPEGTYTYTAGPDYTGSDVFTVAVTDPGFNLLLPFASRQTLVKVNVPCASGGGAGAAAASSAGGTGCGASPNVGASQAGGYDIYNFTGQSLVVTDVVAPDGVVNRVKPAQGLVVRPGETVHLTAVPIAPGAFLSSDPTRVRFGVLKFVLLGEAWAGPTVYDVALSDPLSPKTTCVQGSCTHQSTDGSVFLVDTPGTTWDFAQPLSTNPQGMSGSQLLNALLATSNALGASSPLVVSYENATFTPKTPVPGDYVLAGEPAINPTGNETTKFSVTASVTSVATESSSWEFDAGVGASILEAVDVSVGAKYGTGATTSEEKTFSKTQEFNAIPYSYNALYAAAPQIGLTGDLKVTFAPCTSVSCTTADPGVTFLFRNVDYTYPDPGKAADAVEWLTFTQPYQKVPNQGFVVKDAEAWANPTFPLDPAYQVGEKRQLITKAYVGSTVALPEDFTRTAVYTSSDETVATVSASGLVTSLSPGVTRITATYAWVSPSGVTGQVQAFMDVTVEAAAG